MMWSSIVTGLAALTSVANAVTVFTAPQFYSKPGVSYARAAVLHDGSFLVIFENYAGEPPYFPIFESKDQGSTWREKSRIYDTSNSGGLRYHPSILQLPFALGEYPEGSIVVSGTAVPKDGSQTKLETYVSKDNGLTWSFTSTIAAGGIALEGVGKTPVWHSFLFPFNNKLLVYFADQRDPSHASKIVLSDTSDLHTWSPPTDQVALRNPSLHPSVPIVTEIGNNQYLLSYELGNDRPSYAIRYRITSSPYEFARVQQGIQLIDNKGESPTGAPYSAFVSGGGGSVIVSSSDRSDLLINRKPDASGPWELFSNNAPVAYARAVVPIDADRVLVVGAGPLGGGPNPDDRNSVTANVIKVSAEQAPAKAPAPAAAKAPAPAAAKAPAPAAAKAPAPAAAPAPAQPPKGVIPKPKVQKRWSA